jgi:hypothetical protein
MGASGIKRRKPKRKLRDFTDDLPPGDERRAFGRFEWNQYSPAGQLERGWFASRQVARYGTRHAARKSLRMLWLSLPIVALTVGAIVIVSYAISRIS